MSTKAKHRVLFKDYLKAQLKDPAFKKAFNKADLPVRIAIALAQLRERREQRLRIASPGIDRAAVEQLQRVWPRIAVGRKREIVRVESIGDSDHGRGHDLPQTFRERL